MPYRPWVGRTIGIEFEILEDSPSGRYIGRKVKEAMAVEGVAPLNLDREIGWFKSDGRTWDVKTDRSCGLEIASPALTLDEQGHNEMLRRACAALNRVGAQVDNSCGLHVHVDFSGQTWRDLQRLVALWARYEPYFFELCPRYRATRHFCEPIRRSQWSDWSETNLWTTKIRSLLTQQNESTFRFAASTSFPRGSLNVQGWWQHGRVEFRLQAGSLTYGHVRRWAMLLLSLVERAIHPTAPKPGLTINQPRPELGFSGGYVFQVLGLRRAGYDITHRWFDEIAPEAEDLFAWAERRRKFLLDPASPNDGYRYTPVRLRGSQREVQRSVEAFTYAD